MVADRWGRDIKSAWREADNRGVVRVKSNVWSATDH